MSSIVYWTSIALGGCLAATLIWGGPKNAPTTDVQQAPAWETGVQADVASPPVFHVQAESSARVAEPANVSDGIPARSTGDRPLLQPRPDAVQRIEPPAGPSDSKAPEYRQSEGELVPQPAEDASPVEAGHSDIIPPVPQ